MSFDEEHTTDSNATQGKVHFYREDLAMDRTVMANERTFMAYARTAIMLGVSGVTIIKLLRGQILLQITGYLLLPIAASVALAGYFRFRRIRRHLNRRHGEHKDAALMQIDIDSPSDDSH